MKFKPKKWGETMTGTVRTFPVEVAVVGYCFVAGALLIADMLPGFDIQMALIPLFFMGAYVLNNLVPRGYLRWIYRFCWVAVPVLWMVDVEDWIPSPGYFVSLLCGVLLVLVCRRKKENGRFVAEVVDYIYNVIIAFAFALISFLLLVAIYQSLVYIFGLDSSFIPDFHEYAALTAFGVAAPLMLLTFLNGMSGTVLSPGRMFDILLNYILTPALLVYTAILYLYFVKIVVVWSLPRGGVAYMVFAFTLVATVVKACQPLLGKRVYDWFFNRFSAISLPALAMFWVGTVTRVQDYGLTQERCYLLLCGVTMTLCIALFFSRRTGNYYFLCVVTAGLFALFTYIPPVSARTLAVRNQQHRVERIASQLGLLDSAGNFVRERRPESDTVYKEEYRRMYEALEYLGEEKEPLYGLASAGDVMQIVPGPLQDYVRWGEEELSESVAYSAYLDDEGMRVGLEDYRTLQMLSSGGGGDRVDTNGDTLRLWLDDRPVLTLSYDELLRGQLAKIGYTPENYPPEDTLTKYAPELLLFRGDSLGVVLSFMRLGAIRGKGLVINGLNARCVLIR